MDRKDKDRRDSRRDDSRTGSRSDKRSYEKRSDKSRSRSRDRKRDRNGRRSRSRSQDRKRDRGDKDDDKGKRDRADKDDDKGRNDRGKKTHRYDGDRDREKDRDHHSKKSNHDSKSKDVKSTVDEVVEDYDDSTLKEFEDFITEENVDQVQEAERLAAERKLRREQILQKYNAEKSVSAPTSVELSMNSLIKNAYIVKQNDFDRLSAISGNIDATVSLSAATSLAALVIAEIADSLHGNNGSNGNNGVTGASDVTSLTPDAAVTKTVSAIEGSENGVDVDKQGDLIDGQLEGEGTVEGTEDSAELLDSVARVAVSVLTSHASTLSAGGTSTTDIPNSADPRLKDLYHTSSESTRFTNEIEERLAEKNAIRQDAHSHKESQPFDMFSSSPSDVERGIKGGNAGAWAGKRALREALLEGEDPHLQSNWDDGEGYYKPRIGELIGDQYQTMGIVGKGVFSVVIKCMDLKVKDGEPVAIKVIRNNDTMRKAADKERAILLSICEKDPENKRHCVRLIAHFEFRNHVAFVFDYQQMNLRETLKKFGKDVGINIGAVRMYARQLLVALRHLSDLKIVHADIKLDNILCSGDLKQVKLCDFGSAFRETDTDNDPTPYLVSRFYRAPEIILGLPYDRAIDLWSVAVCLYELFTGHVMFPGRTNNEMLRLMMAIKGRIANKQLKSHFRAYEAMSLDAHFDERDLKFKQMELDPVTGKQVQRLVDITQPSKDLASVIRSSKAGSDDGRLVSSLADLLDKCLALDPLKRISVMEALKHPFFTQH